MSRVLVVGGGIAGPLDGREGGRRRPRGRARHQGRARESNTRYAQGGVAAALFPDDSVERHVADTLAAGAGLTDPDAVRVLCDEGPERVRDLIRFGVAFDRGDSGPRARASRRPTRAPASCTPAATRPAPRSRRALVATVRRRAVRIHERTMLVDLLVEHGRVVGARAARGIRRPRRRARRRGRARHRRQRSLYRHTTNPDVATGDGVAVAHRAGAAVADLEFFQFHPTALATPGHSADLRGRARRGRGAASTSRRAVHARRRPAGPSWPRATSSPARCRGAWPSRAGASGVPGRDRPRRRRSWPSASRASTPRAAGRATTGRRSPFRSRPPRTTGWAACSPTSRAHDRAGPVRRRRGRLHRRARRQPAGLQLAARGAVFADRVARALDDAWPAPATAPARRDPTSHPICRHSARRRRRPRRRLDGGSADPSATDGGEPVDRAALQALMWEPSGSSGTRPASRAASARLAGLARARGARPPHRRGPNLLASRASRSRRARPHRSRVGAHFRSDDPATARTRPRPVGRSGRRMPLAPSRDGRRPPP